MNGAGTNDHTWARARLAAWAAGLLDETGAARLESHLGACDACRRAADALRGAEFTADDRGEHLPADVIARWDRRAAELRGLERELVRKHLERCATCREELVVLGHRAELPGIGPERPALRVEPRKSRLRVPVAWWLASGGLAAAASYLLFFQPSLESRRGAPDLPSTLAPRARPGGDVPVAVLHPDGASTTTTSETPRAGRPANGRPADAPLLLALGPDAADALSLPVRVRGGMPGGDSSTAVPVSRFAAMDSAFRIRVPLALALYDADTPFEIVVRSAGGAVVRRLAARVGDATDDSGLRALTLRQGPPRLVPGDYELRFEIGVRGTAVSETLSYRFRLE